MPLTAGKSTIGIKVMRILPLCTSHSSGIGTSADNLHELCPDSVNWLEGERFEAGAAKDAVRQWLDSSITESVK